MGWADWEFYRDGYGGAAPEAEIAPYLERASDAVDALTFSRVHAIGWDGLTDFQRSLVLRACCIQADFLWDNADALESALSSYSINGVSMAFGNESLYRMVGGVAVSNAAMACLEASGLACLMARPREVR